MNKLLGPPFSKYTHTEKKNTYVEVKNNNNNKKRKNTILPPQEKRTPITPQTEVSMATVKE